MQEIYARVPRRSRRGADGTAHHAMLVDACVMAGVELGAFDRRVLAWLSGWEPETGR